MEVKIAPQMSLMDKLKILADAAKYDVSCSSSGSSRKNDGTGIGNTVAAGLCHSFGADGRCISLLKILFTNECIYDCRYCINRRSNDVPRASFTPDEVCNLTMEFYRRNYIEGLFLSSGILYSPNYTMELICETVHRLRTLHRFQGYIHVKAIPGADPILIQRAGYLADRMSVNLEMATAEGLRAVAPNKHRKNILKPMRQIQEGITENKNEITLYKHAPHFCEAGQSTQMVIGALPESDYQIMSVAENLYQKFSLKRVYYSAFVSVNADKSLAKAVFDLCGLSNDQIEEINSYEILYCSKNLSAAVVVKFPSSGKLKDFLTVEKDGKKDDSAYTAKKDKGDINGNCLLYTMNEGARDISKKA